MALTSISCYLSYKYGTWRDKCKIYYQGKSDRACSRTNCRRKDKTSNLQDQQNDDTNKQIKEITKNKLLWSKSVLGVERTVKYQMSYVEGTWDVLWEAKGSSLLETLEPDQHSNPSPTFILTGLGLLVKQELFLPLLSCAAVKLLINY